MSPNIVGRERNAGETPDQVTVVRIGGAAGSIISVAVPVSKMANCGVSSRSGSQHVAVERNANRLIRSTTPDVGDFGEWVSPRRALIKNDAQLWRRSYGDNG